MGRTVIGRRRSGHGPPPRVLYEGLTQPHRQRSRRWLDLLPDEQEPAVLEAKEPSLVVWGSLWPRFPSARVTIELVPDTGGQGTDLTWTLDIDEPAPEAGAVGHLRRRLNVLINGHLRDYFDC